MTRTIVEIIALFLIGCVVMGSSCCNDDEELADVNPCLNASVGRYYLTPTEPQPSPPDPHMLFDMYVFHSDEPDVEDPCVLRVYDDCPDQENQYFQYRRGSGCSVASFDAQVGNFMFNGTAIRGYDTGSGPFATGFYQGPNGESGTFEFYEEGRMPTP